MLIFYSKDCLEGHLEVEIYHLLNYTTDDKNIINCLTELAKQHGQFQQQEVTLEQNTENDELIFDGQMACIPNEAIPMGLIAKIIENDVYSRKYK